jgi:hypothetical protein
VILAKEEEEWGDSNDEEPSSESEIELDSDSSTEEKNPKKRRTSKGKAEAETKKLTPNVRSSTLPPRPSKQPNDSADLPAKGYQQFTASTPSPSKSRPQSSSPSSPMLSSFSPSAASPGPSLRAPTDSDELGEGVVGYGSHEHHTWTFLHKHRKDKFGRSPDHPDFNPRTISFPPQFIKDQTPAMKQWCEVKADNFDTILFFKVWSPDPLSLSSFLRHPHCPFPTSGGQVL